MTEYALYLDDSGHPADQPHVVVGGFVATEGQWLAFDLEWKVALNKFGLGAVFHMADFERQRRKDRGRVLEDLTAIVNKHTAASFSCLVDMDGYKKTNDVYPLEECIGTPYSVAARGVVRNINIWKGENFRPNDHLLVFVEKGSKHKGDMEEAFRRDSLPIPQAVPKAHLRVQPADMLAWEVFHYTKSKKMRRSLTNLLKGRDMLHGTFWERNLIQSCQLLGLPLRTKLPTNAEIVYSASPKRKRRRTIK